MSISNRSSRPSQTVWNGLSGTGQVVMPGRQAYVRCRHFADAADDRPTRVCLVPVPEFLRRRPHDDIAPRLLSRRQALSHGMLGWHQWGSRPCRRSLLSVCGVAFPPRVTPRQASGWLTRQVAPHPRRHRGRWSGVRDRAARCRFPRGSDTRPWSAMMDRDEASRRQDVGGHRPRLRWSSEALPTTPTASTHDGQAEARTAGIVAVVGACRGIRFPTGSWASGGRAWSRSAGFFGNWLARTLRDRRWLRS